MADSLRDLVVSLSLNTDNFTRNIKSVNKQILEAESFFKLAASGLTSFESSVAGLQSKLTMLQRKLELQKNVVTQYEKALTAANAIQNILDEAIIWAYEEKFGEKKEKVDFYWLDDYVKKIKLDEDSVTIYWRNGERSKKKLTIPDKRYHPMISARWRRLAALWRFSLNGLKTFRCGLMVRK